MAEFASRDGGGNDLKSYLVFNLRYAEQSDHARTRFGLRNESPGKSNILRVHPRAAAMDVGFFFSGEQNEIVIGPDCAFRGTVIVDGRGAKATFRGGNPAMNLQANLYSESVLVIDQGVTAYGLRVWVATRTELSIGERCQFSEGISIRTTDHHTIFDIDTLEQQNLPESVRIAACVWLGQDVIVLKGAKIGIGSIIGAKSLVKGVVPPMELWAGAPARMLRQNVSWADPHPANEEQLRARLHMLRRLRAAETMPLTSSEKASGELPPLPK